MFYNLRIAIMPRPIEYDKQDVLSRALAAFWQQGYAACSYQILVQETGMSRQGLYNVFGDKDAIFQAAVDHYRSLVRQNLGPLKKPNVGLADIRTYIETSIEAQQRLGPGGCFLVITAFSPQANDPKIKHAIELGADDVRSAFCTVLEKHNGQYLNDTKQSSTDVAAYLYSVMNGLSALLNTGGTQSQLNTALDIAFEILSKTRTIK